MSVAEKMTELADAVRDLTGTTELMTLDEMIQNIRDMGGSDIIGNAEGHIIQISDCVTRKLHGLRLYGKTVQNGIPSPVSPVEPVNLGENGSITVHVDDQTLIISTPNGLPGVPVAQNGNYTDANGQQWICDEIDFVRGKYVQRVKKKPLSEMTWYIAGSGWVYSDNIEDLVINTKDNNQDAPNIAGLYCTHLSHISRAEVITATKIGIGAWSDKVNNYCRIGAFSNMNLTEWKAFISEKEVCILYTPENTVELNLPNEELSAYSELHTNYPHTTIYNDADAWMTVKYAADTATTADYIAALQELGVEV